MKRIHLLLVVLLSLACSGVAQARAQIVLQRSGAAEKVAAAVAGELHALGMDVRTTGLGAAVPPGADAVVVCTADAAPVEVRFATDGSREIVHLVSGSNANESAIRVSEIVRARVLADSLPRAAVGRLPEVSGEKVAPGWHDAEEPSPPTESDADDGVDATELAPAHATAHATDKDAAVAKTPPPEARAAREEPDHPSPSVQHDDVKESFRTALWLGGGAFVWATDLPPAASLEGGIGQTLWGFVTVGFRGGLQASSTNVTGSSDPLEMSSLHFGGDVGFQLFARGPFSVHAGIGASAIRFEFIGTSDSIGVLGTTHTEWTPWVRAGAVARVALSDHLGLYLDGNVGSLLTELRVFGPGFTFSPGSAIPDGADARLTSPEDQGPWGPMATVGPAVLQVGLGLEVAWDF